MKLRATEMTRLPMFAGCRKCGKIPATCPNTDIPVVLLSKKSIPSWVLPCIDYRRFSQVGFLQVGPSQVGSLQVGPSQVGPSQVGSLQGGFLQGGPEQINCCLMG